MTKRTHDFAALYELDAAPLEHCLAYAEQQRVVAQMEEMHALLMRVRRRVFVDWTQLPLELWVAILSRDNCSLRTRRVARTVCRLFRDATDLSCTTLSVAAASAGSQLTSSSIAHNIRTLVVSSRTSDCPHEFDAAAVLGGVALPHLRNLCISVTEFPAALDEPLRQPLDEFRLTCYTGITPGIKQRLANSLPALFRRCSIRRFVVESSGPSAVFDEVAGLIRDERGSGRPDLLTVSTFTAVMSVECAWLDEDDIGDEPTKYDGDFDDVLLIDSTCSEGCFECKCAREFCVRMFTDAPLYIALQNFCSRDQRIFDWMDDDVISAAESVDNAGRRVFFVDNFRNYHHICARSWKTPSNAVVVSNMTRRKRNTQQDADYRSLVTRIQRACEDFHDDDNEDDANSQQQAPLIFAPLVLNDPRGHPFVFPTSIPLPREK